MKTFPISRILSAFSLVLFLVSCGGNNSKTFTLEPMEASGEFLFEGPNTLQGNLLINEEELADLAGISASEIVSVNVASISLELNESGSENNIESALVQVVSNDLPLQSVGTLNGFSAGSNMLSANKDLDILGYLKDQSSSLIVDANLSRDMDELSVSVTFELTLKY